MDFITAWTEAREGGILTCQGAKLIKGDTLSADIVKAAALGLELDDRWFIEVPVGPQRPLSPSDPGFVDKSPAWKTGMNEHYDGLD